MFDLCLEEHFSYDLCWQFWVWVVLTISGYRLKNIHMLLSLFIWYSRESRFKRLWSKKERNGWLVCVFRERSFELKREKEFGKVIGISRDPLFCSQKHPSWWATWCSLTTQIWDQAHWRLTHDINSELGHWCKIWWPHMYFLFLTLFFYYIL